MPRLTKEQLEGRRLGMGGTDIVEVVLGADGRTIAPWDGAGPMRVFMIKTGPVEEVDDEATPEMDWGHTMEPVICDWYAKTYGRQVLPGGQVSHHESPWQWSTLDYTIVSESTNIEIKNVGSPAMAPHWDLYADDGVPRYVRAQALLGMYNNRKRRCEVVASVCGRPPHMWVVEYDDEAVGLMLADGERFWRNTQQGIPPKFDDTPASKAYLRRTYPMNIDREIVELDDDEDELIQLGRDRAAAALDEKRGASEKARLDCEIMKRIGTRAGVVCDYWKMTWKVNKNGDRRQRFTMKGDPDE